MLKVIFAILLVTSFGGFYYFNVLNKDTTEKADYGVKFHETVTLSSSREFYLNFPSTYDEDK